MNIELKEMIDIKKIVINKAKYQKVMLLYDDSVSRVETRDIYELIKKDCIYNEMNINNVDQQELMNGYKLVIFYMSGQKFLNFDLKKDEFVNIFIPTDNYILPFVYDNEKCRDKIMSGRLSNNTSKGFSDGNYLILNSEDIDLTVFSSVYFNRVYTYISDLIYHTHSEINFDKLDNILFNKNIVDILNKEDNNLRFVDVEIIKQNNLIIRDLVLLDYILLVAFVVFVKAIKDKTLSMIDVYKVAQNDNDKINHFYEMMNNYTLIERLNLNFNCLTNIIKANKENVLELITNSYEEEDVMKIIEAVRNFSKNCDGILGFMYFYNVFSY